VLGFELEAKWIEEKFTSLDFEISTKTKGSWTIIPPSFRFDIINLSFRHNIDICIQ
jgi:phenylalanyl-tRNA synthetase beta subunit